MNAVDKLPIFAVISIFSIIFLRLCWESYWAWNLRGENDE